MTVKSEMRSVIALLSVPDVVGLFDQIVTPRNMHLQQLGLQRNQLRRYLDGCDQTGESSDAVSDQAKLVEEREAG